MNHLLLWHIVFGLGSSLLGSLMHFVYGWSGNNTLVGYFTPINESTWEHLKLLFFPILYFSIIEMFLYGHDYPNFLQVKILSILIGLAVIVIFFYTYSGILGKTILLIDISIFLLGVIASYVSSYYLLQSTCCTSQLARFALLLCLIILLFSFIVFTDKPPMLAIFLDPVTDTYGRAPNT